MWSEIFDIFQFPACCGQFFLRCHDLVGVESLGRFLQFLACLGQLGFGRGLGGRYKVLCAVVRVRAKLFVFLREILRDAFQLLFFTQNGFFGAAFVVPRVGQFFDAVFNLIAVRVQLFIGWFDDFLVQRFTAAVGFGHVIYDFNLKLVFLVCLAPFSKVFFLDFIGKFVSICHDSLLSKRGLRRGGHRPLLPPDHR